MPKNKIIREEEIPFIESLGHRGKPLVWKATMPSIVSGFELGVSEYDAEEFPEQKIHEDEEAIYIISGEGVIRIGSGDKAEEFAFKKGSAIYIPPKTPHCIKKTGKMQLKAVYCHSGFLNKK